MSREPGLRWIALRARLSRGIQRGGARHRARARGGKIRAGDYRASRQMALRTRRKSTCRRTTSNGSVTLITPGSHVTDRTVQAASGMWTVRTVTSGGIRVATCPRGTVIPGSPPGLLRRRRPLAGREDAGPARRALALTEPAERRFGPGSPGVLLRRQVLAVAPGAARALLVMPFPARDADHVSIVRSHPGIASLDAGKSRT